ncbi:MAG: tRNA 4-thiouridine(8) synthase ThiI, partial [Fusobacteriaceae bacterium]|nr:tRNA 4-thiouridine(8) synthase ThiI [Fusobacteriaceae bacterium]
MYSDIILREGEMVLKGRNRRDFEYRLIKNVKRVTKDFKGVSVERSYGRIYIRNANENTMEIIKGVKLIPGIYNISPIMKTDKNLDNIKAKALEMLKKAIVGKKTFKVEAKRADKTYPLDSMEISRQVGGYILAMFDGELSVDVRNPDVVVNVEVTFTAANIYSEKIEGAGGLPIGTSGRGLTLLSGGIDSPVAIWMGLKRGVEMDALHFHSFPFTSERSKEKVVDLTKILAKHTGKMKLYVINFTEIQKIIGLKCPKEYYITIMRRFMLRIATVVANKYDYKALFTGDSIGQVASQTLESMAAINAVTTIPVIRPLASMDKHHIIQISREIGTYETSILPYEDCCTVFVPQNPVIRPEISVCEEGEKELDIDKLIE